MASDAEYYRWKQNAFALYDLLYNHNVMWPSLCVCWGTPHATKSVDDSASAPPQHRDGTSSINSSKTTAGKDGGAHSYSRFQTLYFSSRTDARYNAKTRTWSGSPNFLLSATVELFRPRCSNYKGIGRFNEMHKSGSIQIAKKISHPGEVNKIQLCPQNNHVVATHSDSELTYVWNMKTQEHRVAGEDSVASVPDLTLVGHQAISEYALAWNKVKPHVISGGSDNLVLIWSVEDHITSLSSPDASGGRAASGEPARKKVRSSDGFTMVNPRCTFEGHTATVEDVEFHPSHTSGVVAASVGDDRSLRMWDGRQSGSSCCTHILKDAHDDDINCVTWNHFDEHVLATGSSDGVIQVYDTRKLGSSSSSSSSPVTLKIDHAGETSLGNITGMRWSPHNSTVLAHGDDDAMLCVWDTATDDPLLFKHCGHRRGIVDFDWNSHSPWTIASMSDDGELGGGTLQVWRISDFVHSNDPNFFQEVEDALQEASKPGEKGNDAHDSTSRK